MVRLWIHSFFLSDNRVIPVRILIFSESYSSHESQYLIMDLGDLFLRFIDQFHEVLRTADASGMETSGLPDVTIHQFFYLQEIERNEDITLTELAQVLGVTKPSVTAAVAKLVKQGFVSRTRSSEDQRKYHLALTERGHQIILNKQRAYKKYVELLESSTTDEDQKILVNAFMIMTSCFP